VSIEIISTEDGSNSLRQIQLNETYHSVHGAVQESIHVFIRNGLAAGETAPETSILEVGFGTGLNALLTWQFARQHGRKVKYTAIEPCPISEKVWSKLNYPVLLGESKAYRSLHLSQWGITVPLDPVFELFKIRMTLQDVAVQPGVFDVAYYDAFAPSKQPELWDIEVLRKVVAALKCGGLFVTYCAKGQLKRDLRNLGMIVETLAGPPGKKEMVRARKA
jgi:tRNA U34 5-methylaminomethyl-2-thiouridine-forming methyltransferase MnmC